MTALNSDELADTLVAEFTRQIPGDPILTAERIYRSHDFPDSRWVMKVETAQQGYALKIDTQSPRTGRLVDEFRILSQLHSHLAGNGPTRVVRPVYLSPSAMFLVTEFIDRPTAVDVIYNSTDDKQVAQVYRRAGAWLQDLHNYRPARQQPFWPQWMMERIRDSSATILPDIRPDYQRMMNIMRADATHLRGQPDLEVFSHGDFHGMNLILGHGAAIGLDFTEARDKLAVYDIVDFLKADVFRAGETPEIDRSGILNWNKQMFFRRYRHPINMDVLDFCIRGRLLRDWLLLRQQNQTYSEFEQRRADRLELRLKQSLTEPLI